MKFTPFNLFCSTCLLLATKETFNIIIIKCIVLITECDIVCFLEKVINNFVHDFHFQTRSGGILVYVNMLARMDRI